MSDDGNIDYVETMAKSLVALCVRNGYLEELHSGIQPSSKKGDFSDVKVVTPYGEIPWKEVSRLDNAQMKILMKDIVDSVYTVLLHEQDTEFMLDFLLLGHRFAAKWDTPQEDPKMMKPKAREIDEHD